VVFVCIKSRWQARASLPEASNLAQVCVKYEPSRQSWICELLEKAVLKLPEVRLSFLVYKRKLKRIMYLYEKFLSVSFEKFVQLEGMGTSVQTLFFINVE